jgi:DNA-directed RNA polymerase subunit RPC12/RpoP
MGRPRKHFTIVREGEVLGRFSREFIIDGLKEGHFKPEDKFKDPRDCTWKGLNSLTDKITCRVKRKRGPKRSSDESDGSSGKSYYASQLIYLSDDYACSACFEIASGSVISSYVDGRCPICGSKRFKSLR